MLFFFKLQLGFDFYIPYVIKAAALAGIPDMKQRLIHWIPGSLLVNLCHNNVSKPGLFQELRTLSPCFGSLNLDLCYLVVSFYIRVVLMYDPIKEKSQKTGYRRLSFNILVQ